ncbi:MAG: phenylacetate--CoA ligase family protein [Candidatus Freyarchaeota archaeon]|nr:phenylacetate--CoA ligase family protein [Candidatus Jordarchaeia archaeon]MBS7269295.1 phenylacetate--CoA ligase family protein [Candidatus Jordarchaeia archaeon]MBS7280088.1 phenylacetate--CoA ligase family protein [Candidatus Jordarchaeia archaeon]
MWRRNIETMPRKELEKLQEESLKKQLKYVYDNTRFYNKKFKEAGVTPEDFKTLKDIKKFPLTTKQDIKKEVTTDDPFGGRCAIPRDKIWGITTPPEPEIEEPPIMSISTEYEREVLVDHLTRHLVMIGLSNGDILELQASQWESIAALIEGHFRVRRTVQSLIPFTSIPIENTLFLLDAPRATYLTKFFKPNIIITTVDYAKLMMQELEKEKSDPKTAFQPKIVVHRFRPGSPLLDEKTREEFKRTWGGTHLSMIDLGYGGFYAMECLQCNGHHAWEDGFLVETVEPETGQPVNPGEKGMLVFTNLYAEATPLVRFATGHNARLDTNPCDCGRTHVRIFLE